MKGYVTVSELLILFSTLVLFFVLSKLYNYNAHTTRSMPYIYAIISYYSHTVFIFKRIFDEEGDSSQVHMSKDSLNAKDQNFLTLIYAVTAMNDE